VRLTNRYDADASSGAFAFFRRSVSKTSVNQPQIAVEQVAGFPRLVGQAQVSATHAALAVAQPSGKGRCSHPRLNDNIGSCAGNDSFDLRLLGLGHSELVKSLLKIVEEGFPLCCGDHQILVGVLHRAARVLLRPTGSPADHFRDEGI
jgi:hypothetical protein